MTNTAPPSRPVLSILTIGLTSAVVFLLPVAVGLVVPLAVALPDASGRIEAVKAGAIVGIGLCGVVGLLLAARRQRGLELERWDRYRAAQEAVAETAADRERQVRAEAEQRDAAAERRVTDLYARAVEQLGSDRAAVRLGGLYALERLAQDTVPLRQLVVDLLRAYLRMPLGATGEQAQRQELEVRATVQRVLHRHLICPAPDGTPADEPGADPAAPHWPGMDIDLTGAVLDHLTLTGCDVGSAGFDGATFQGGAGMDRARFRGAARFEGARFTGDATFTGTRFDAEARFARARVDGDALFGNVEFGADALFERARFKAAARFEKARFTGTAEFRDAEFTGPTGFRRAWFGASARFDGGRFAGPATFDHARFDGDVRFGQAQFADATEFAGALADDWSPARPSSWPQGWTTRAAEEPGRLAVVEAGEAAGQAVPAQATRTDG